MGIWSVARSSLQSVGVRRTLRAAPRYLRQDWWAHRRRHAARRRLEREDAFDARHGTDTTSLVRRDRLAGISSTREAVLYWPILPRTFDKILARLPIDHERHVFIDLGCGKGRALLLASEYPFKQIIGVEFSPQLVEVAEHNRTTYRSASQQCDRIAIHLADAAQFALPDDPLVIFMFDPFRPPVLTAVLENLRQSLVRTPRPVWLAYVSPHADEAHLLDFLECVHEEPGGLPEQNLEYPWSIYSTNL